MNKLYFSPFLFMCISIAAQSEPDSNLSLIPDSLLNKLKLTELIGKNQNKTPKTWCYRDRKTIDNMPIYTPPDNIVFNMPLFKPDPNFHFNMPAINPSGKLRHGLHKQPFMLPPVWEK